MRDTALAQRVRDLLVRGVARAERREAGAPRHLVALRVAGIAGLAAHGVPQVWEETADAMTAAVAERSQPDAAPAADEGTMSVNYYREPNAERPATTNIATALGYGPWIEIVCVLCLAVIPWRHLSIPAAIGALVTAYSAVFLAMAGADGERGMDPQWPWLCALGGVTAVVLVALAARTPASR